MSLHRLASLARKQGAKCVVVEDASTRSDVMAEIDHLDDHCGGGGAAEAIAFSFFSAGPEEVGNGGGSKEALLGQCVLINYRQPSDTDFSLSYIFEAIFATPKVPLPDSARASGQRNLLNNFINAENVFSVEVLGRTYDVCGVCFCQQNGVTSVCAHASIRMVLRTLAPQNAPPTTRQMNALIGQPCEEGMYPGEITDVMAQLGGVVVDQVNCRDLPPAEYISIITAAAEAGELALLVFSTQRAIDLQGDAKEAENSTENVANEPADHVVVVFGYTRNSDEWHPQAIPAYAGAQSAAYCPSSSWVDHFVIHDDNFGPYFTLSTRALEVDPSINPKTLLIVRREPCEVEAHAAEIAASLALSQLLPSLAPMRSEPWFAIATGSPRTFVTRPVLISRDAYIEHLRGAAGHDGSKATASELRILKQLPSRFWMVEYTLADLLTGNRAKLGEVLILTEWSAAIEGDRRNLVMAIRLPGLMLQRPGSAEGLDPHRFSIASHCEMYMHKPHDHQW